MSVLIKGLIMPSCCGECFLCEPYSIGCRLLLTFLDREDYMHERRKDCPLVEVKEPHGRLIDGDALQCKVDDIGLGYYEVLGVTEDTIDSAPTVIEAEGSENNA